MTTTTTGGLPAAGEYPAAADILDGKTPDETVKARNYRLFILFNLVLAGLIVIAPGRWVLPALFAAIIDQPFFLVGNFTVMQTFPGFIALFPLSGEEKRVVIIPDEAVVQFDVTTEGATQLVVTYRQDGREKTAATDCPNFRQAYAVLMRRYPERSARLIRQQQMKQYMEAHSGKGSWFRNMGAKIRCLLTRSTTR